MNLDLLEENDMPVYMMTLNGEAIYNGRCAKEEDYFYYYEKNLTRIKYEKRRRSMQLYPSRELPLSMDSIQLRGLIQKGNPAFHLKKVSSQEAYGHQFYKTNVLISVEFGRDPNYKKEAHAEGEEEGQSKRRSMEAIRSQLYKDGFFMQCTMGDGSERQCHFVAYKRSSSAVKEGRHLFIMEEFAKPMSKWTWLGLDVSMEGIQDGKSLVHIKAYEALVNSVLQKEMLTLKPEEILLVEDVYHEYSTEAKVLHYRKQEIHMDYLKDYPTETNLFDGQSLLDASLFEGRSLKGQPRKPGMMLLRNHFFKTCAFHTDIQRFMRENYLNEDGSPCQEICDMFGRKLKTADIRMITTPSSLKLLKLTSFLAPLIQEKTGQEAGDSPEKILYEYWLHYISDPQGSNGKFANQFGVVKYESLSPWGNYQRMSYQMINSLPLSREDMSMLLEREHNYMDLLRSNDKDLQIAEAVQDMLACHNALAWWKDQVSQDLLSSEANKRKMLLEARDNLRKDSDLTQLLQEIQKLKQTKMTRGGSLDQKQFGLALAYLKEAEKELKQISNVTSKLNNRIDMESLSPEDALEAMASCIDKAWDGLLQVWQVLTLRYEYHTQAFLHHVKHAKGSISGELISDLSIYSNEFHKTKLFRDYRRDVIHHYKETLYSGKVKVPGDYYVLLSMPLEMLYHAIGFFHGQEIIVPAGRYKGLTLPVLKKGEVYNQNLKAAGAEHSVLFRNPHICASNVVVARQVDTYPIEDYFSIGSHVIVVTPWESNILRRLQGADFDSDTVLCTTDPIIIKRAKEVAGYPVAFNGLLEDLKGEGPQDKMPYSKRLAKLDHKLSRNRIGAIVNLSQLLNSYFWHDYYQKKDSLGGQDLPLEWIQSHPLYNDILTLEVLTEVEIDKAKHSEYMGIDMTQILRSIRERKDQEGELLLKTFDNRCIYPAFYKYAIPKKVYYMKKLERGKQQELWGKMKAIHCPMNHLMEVLDKFRFPSEPQDCMISMEEFFQFEDYGSQEIPASVTRLLELVRFNAMLLKTNQWDEGILQAARSLRLTRKDIGLCLWLVYREGSKAKDPWKQYRILILSLLHASYPKEFRSCLVDKHEVFRKPLVEILNPVDWDGNGENSLDYTHKLMRIWGKVYGQ